MRSFVRQWRSLLALAVTLIVVIGGSIALVRFHNRERGVTDAVLWAAADLAAVPDSVVVGAYAIETYREATRRLPDVLRGLPVDSVRAFYQQYCQWARDGIITADELREAAPCLGLTPSPTADPADTSAVNPVRLKIDGIP